MGAGVAAQQLPKGAAEAGAPSDAAVLGSWCVCGPCESQLTDTLKQVPIELTPASEWMIMLDISCRVSAQKGSSSGVEERLD